MNKYLLPSLAAAFLGFAAPASATLLDSENFDYASDGTTDLGNFTANGGFGFTTPWFNVGGVATRGVTPGSLSYPASTGYTASGNKATITTTTEGFATTVRNIGGSLANNVAGVRYMSFLMSTNNLSAYNQYGLGEDTTTKAVTFGFDSGQFTMEATGASSKVYFGTPTVGITYLFVAKITNDGTNSVASVSAFAPGDTVPGTEGSWQATTSSFTSITLNRFYGFQGPNSLVNLDEIRIGDSYADVVSAASAIPEPSTYAALAGLGMLGFALLRRRRKAA